MTRIYRLRRLLAFVNACKGWRRFVRRFQTADEVLDAVNANPRRSIGGSQVGVASDVRSLAEELAFDLGDETERRYWFDRFWATVAEDEPISRVERRRLFRLWQRYADKYGLFEEAAEWRAPLSAELVRRGR